MNLALEVGKGRRDRVSHPNKMLCAALLASISAFSLPAILTCAGTEGKISIGICGTAFKQKMEFVGFAWNFFIQKKRNLWNKILTSGFPSAGARSRSTRFELANLFKVVKYSSTRAKLNLTEERAFIAASLFEHKRLFHYLCSCLRLDGYYLQ